jgi:hypothetical protein
MQQLRSTISKYLLVPFITSLTALILPQPALAQSLSAADRGLAVVDEWCRSCHVRTAAEKSPDTAPLFQEIIRKPGRNKAYLRAFMDEDHFPMTTFRLFDAEKNDVVEFLISLKRK